MRRTAPVMADGRNRIQAAGQQGRKVSVHHFDIQLLPIVP